MIERDLILDYQLIRGLPGDTEERVQKLLDAGIGWQPKGKPRYTKIDGQEVIIQCMVQYDNEQ